MKTYVQDGPVMTEVEHPRHWPDSDLFYNCKDADKLIGSLCHLIEDSLIYMKWDAHKTLTLEKMTSILRPDA